MSSILPVPTDDEAALLLWSLAIQPATLQGPHASSIQQCGATSSNSMDADERSSFSSSSSSIHCLPDVLTQLVMQSLTLSELLQFARCSRRLLSQADAAFTFRHVPPLTCAWSVKSPGLARGQLLRHLSIVLKPKVNAASSDAWLAQLPSRLYGLDMTEMKLPSQGRMQLLKHPSMQSLKSITLKSVASWASGEVLATVARLPLLHTLSMLSQANDRPSMESLRLLSAAPSLTSIALNDTDFQLGSVLAGLVAFPGLRQLTVRRPWIYDDEWVAHFASPGLRKLTTLTLDWCIYTGPSGCQPLNPAYADAVFTSLTQLTSLHLQRPFGVDCILPSIGSASALRSLRIETNCFVADAYAERVLPSFTALHALLLAKSSLRIEIDMRDHSSPLRDEYLPKLAADFAAVPADVRSRLIVLYEKPLWV